MKTKLWFLWAVVLVLFVLVAPSYGWESYQQSATLTGGVVADNTTVTFTLRSNVGHNSYLYVPTIDSRGDRALLQRGWDQLRDDGDELQRNGPDRLHLCGHYRGESPETAGYQRVSEAENHGWRRASGQSNFHPFRELTG